MPQSPLEMAKELVMAQMQMGQLQAEQVQDALRQTHASLAALKAQEEMGIMGTSAVASGTETPPMDWRKSITKHAVTCLECGQSLKQLSHRHLQEHGLDGRSYRAKYGIPRTQPLASKTTTARRREVVQKTRPWEQAPTFRKAKVHDGHALPETVADVPRNEIEEPAAAAPVQPKRQRKATQKKQRTRKAAQTT